MYKFSKNIQGASSEESFGSIFKRSPNGNALSFELADSEKSYQSASKAVSALISHARKDPRCMNCIPNLADDFAMKRIWRFRKKSADFAYYTSR